MLTRTHKILLALLLVQAALVVVTRMGGDEAAVKKEQPLLAGFDAAKVTRLHITGEDGTTVDLVKRGDAWTVASAFDYPAESQKVTDAVSPIAKMAAADPVASQKARHKQLKVDDTDFTRKVVITHDGKDTTIFVGGPAGARRTAVRIAGSDRVYGVTGVTTSLLGARPADWVNRTYLEIPRDEITKLEIQKDGSTIVLAKVEPPAPADAGSGSAAVPPPPAQPTWTATIDGAPVTPGNDESLDQFQIDSALNTVSRIELDAPADPKRDASKPTATITVERKAGTPPQIIDLVLADKDYWVKERGRDRAITVPASRFETMLGITRDKLIKKGAPATPSPAPQIHGLPPGMELPPGMMPGPG